MFNLFTFDIKSFFDKRIFISEIEWGGWYEVESYEEKLPSISLDSIKIPDIVKPLLESVELPEESMLMNNYIFHDLDSEDFTNLDYLEEVFNSILFNTFNVTAKIEEREWIIYINISKEKNIIDIKIIKKEINSKITQNSLIISFNSNWKAVVSWQKYYIQSLLQKLRDFDWFNIDYISDNLKIDRNKDLRDKVTVSSKDNKENIKKELSTINTSVNEDWVFEEDNWNINQIKVINKIFSMQFNNASSYYLWIQEQYKEIESIHKSMKNRWSSLEMSQFHQLTVSDFHKSIENMWIVVDNLVDDMSIITYAKTHKDILDRMKLNIEWWEIIQRRKEVWKIQLWIKKATEKALWYLGLWKKIKIYDFNIKGPTRIK